jgi:hypothetical protein
VWALYNDHFIRFKLINPSSPGSWDPFIVCEAIHRPRYYWRSWTIGYYIRFPLNGILRLQIKPVAGLFLQEKCETCLILTTRRERWAISIRVACTNPLVALKDGLEAMCGELIQTRIAFPREEKDGRFLFVLLAQSPLSSIL